MKKKTPPSVLNKEKAWKLKSMTCMELSKHVQEMLDPAMKPNPSNEALRGRYAHPSQLAKLELCGSLSASHHAQHCKTAARLQVVPTLILTATGGKPQPKDMPRWDVSLKRMAAQNGIVIHRYDKGAFILARNPPKPEAAPAKLCDGSFELEAH